MRVQTPFYVIKRTVVTKEAARAFGYNLALRPYTTSQQDREDLIDFCLAGPKEEKVLLSLGDKVRIKKNAGLVHGFPTDVEAVFSEVQRGDSSPEIRLQFDSGHDYNAIYPDSADLSGYVELI